MIDPVPTGPVSRTSSTAPSTDAKRRIATLTPAPEAVGASANLPRLVTLAADLARQGPPVDYARIAQIRQAIAEGSYKIDPAKIAAAIVTFHSED
jgi:negative regulator of flagellin synthesis FlgM